MLGFDQLFARALALLQKPFSPSAASTTSELPGIPECSYLSVGSYSGDISILSFDPRHEGSLRKVSAYHEDNFAPSWQTVHPEVPDIIYSTDEDASGGLVSFSFDRVRGELKQISRSGGINGSVSIAIHDELVVIAAYSGHSIQSYKTNKFGFLSRVVDSFTYDLPKPGPNAERQESSHPHQVLLDPSNEFVVAPDLGADVLRLYKVEDGGLKELPPYHVDPGSGPRHGAFHQIQSPDHSKLLYYLVNELNNSVSVFHVTVAKGKLNFAKLQQLDTLPPSPTWEASLSTPTAGEIVISNDRRFLYVSNRNDYTFKNTPWGPSDSIAQYAINQTTGLLSFQNLLEAGGITPRHFSFDKFGQFVAIAFQESDSVVIREVNKTSGAFLIRDGFPWVVSVPEGPVCVQWL